MGGHAIILIEIVRMKKHFLLIMLFINLVVCCFSLVLTIMVGFSACQDDKKETHALQQQIDSLEVVNAVHSKQLKDISDFMRVFSNRLDSVAVQENALMENGIGVKEQEVTKEE